MIKVKDMERAFKEMDKWWETATSKERRAFLDKANPPEPGDYYGDKKKKVLSRNRNTKRKRNRNNK